MEEEIDLKELIDLFWKRKLVIILITLIFTVIGLAYTTYGVIPKYKSSTTLLLVQNNSLDEQNQSMEITQTDITLNGQLISTYSVLIKSKAILEQVIQNLNIQNLTEEDLAKNITVKAVDNTQVIEIIYTNEDNQKAYLVANELASVFSDKVAEIYNINNVYIVDKAKVAEEPYNINHIKNISIFSIIGFIISYMVIFFISLLDTTVKKKDDVEKNTDLLVLSQIPNIKIEGGKELITYEDSKSPISEVFKTLRTNLQFTHKKNERFSLLVTSTMPGEGKTWITSNLGIAFAQTNKKVVIIDSDMRKGRLHGVFKTKLFPGLSNYLAEEKGDIKNYLVKTNIENLWIIPAGNVPQNPSELLSGERMLMGFEELKQEFDVILFDSTPCMLVTDAVIISRIVDDTVIVGSYKSTKIENIKNIESSIKNVGGTIAGAIINKIPVSMKKYKSRYYYYGNKDEKNREKLEITKENTTPIEEKKEYSNLTDEDENIMKQIDEYLEKLK